MYNSSPLLFCHSQFTVIHKHNLADEHYLHKCICMHCIVMLLDYTVHYLPYCCCDIEYFSMKILTYLTRHDQMHHNVCIILLLLLNLVVLYSVWKTAYISFHV